MKSEFYHRQEVYPKCGMMCTIVRWTFGRYIMGEYFDYEFDRNLESLLQTDGADTIKASNENLKIVVVSH